MKHLSQNEVLGLFAGIVVVGLTFLGSYANPFQSTQDGTGEQNIVMLANSAQEPAAAALALEDAVSPNGGVKKLVVEDVKVGEGNEVQAGDIVTVHYIGSLTNGTQFDNSYARGTPYTFTVGEGTVIKGWDEGIVGMKVGGQRILVIPPELAYGNRTIGPIPASSPLVFSVELVEMK